MQESSGWSEGWRSTLSIKSSRGPPVISGQTSTETHTPTHTPTHTYTHTHTHSCRQFLWSSTHPGLRSHESRLNCFLENNISLCVCFFLCRVLKVFFSSVCVCVCVCVCVYAAPCCSNVG